MLFRLIVLLLVAAAGWWGHSVVSQKHVAWSDLETSFTEPPPIGYQPGDPLARLGLSQQDVRTQEDTAPVRFLRLAKYLNGARAVVTHTVDDTQPDVPKVLEVLDRHQVKATFFISTSRAPIDDLWPLLARAVRNGHEIGSHSRTHPCQWPPTESFCRFAYTDYELAGSRDDILGHVDQPYVWSFAYPCGLCTSYDFVHRKLKHAGYLFGRAYPNEEHGGHLVPDLATYDENRYSAVYTQAVQEVGGVSPAGRTDLAEINAKFDEVYGKGGIYNFMTHPQWVQFEPDTFYPRHVEYIARRPDIWYVPMGPLYAYHDVSQATAVHFLGGTRFAVVHGLSADVYPNAVTLEFATQAKTAWAVAVDGRPLMEQPPGPTFGWDQEYYRRQGDTLLVTLKPSSVLEFQSVKP